MSIKFVPRYVLLFIPTMVHTFFDWLSCIVWDQMDACQKQCDLMSDEDRDLLAIFNRLAYVLLMIPYFLLEVILIPLETAITIIHYLLIFYEETFFRQ